MSRGAQTAGRSDEQTCVCAAQIPEPLIPPYPLFHWLPQCSLGAMLINPQPKPSKKKKKTFKEIRLHSAFCWLILNIQCRSEHRTRVSLVQTERKCCHGFLSCPRLLLDQKKRREDFDRQESQTNRKTEQNAHHSLEGQ